MERLESSASAIPARDREKRVDHAELVAVTVASPWGPVHVAATGRGIVAVEVLTPRDEFEAGLARRLGRPVRWFDPGVAGGSGADVAIPAMRHLRDAADAIRAEARDDRGEINARDDHHGRADADALGRLPLDLDDRPAWDRAVLDAVRAIPRGQIRSYGEIARAIGRPGAARAVGGAVGRNPVGLLVPCHRVVAGDGTLGGYGGGWWGDRDRLLDLKADLLAREGVVLPRSRPSPRSGR